MTGLAEAYPTPGLLAKPIHEVTHRMQKSQRKNLRGAKQVVSEHLCHSADLVHLSLVVH